MFESLWKQTKTVSLTSRTKVVRDSLAADMAALPPGDATHASLKEAVDLCDAEIARRETDERYRVTVRKIGSPSEPVLLDVISADFEKERALSRARARLLLLEQFKTADVAKDALHVDSFEDAVSSLVMKDAKFKRALYAWNSQRLEHGLVDSKETVKRIRKLAGKSRADQSALIQDVLSEVSAYQEVDEDLGED